MVIDNGERFCSKHKTVEHRHQNKERGTAHQRGYTSAWAKARRFFLDKHPLCAEHQKLGDVVEATVVDHIVPHKGDKDLFWDRSNWQPLCKPCHDRKTAREDGGFGRHTPGVG